MRTFLNISCILIITFSVFIICVPRPLNPESVTLALIPVLVAVLFFFAFLRLLKVIEYDAAEERDIELTSRIIWEFNKSWIIRTSIGKIQAFIEEK